MRPSEVVVFGSARPVTCAVMDGAFRWVAAINHRPRLCRNPHHRARCAFSIRERNRFVLKQDRIVQWELPIEGWGNAVLPGSALMLARLATRRGKIVLKLHGMDLAEPPALPFPPSRIFWPRMLRFVSRQQKETFQKTPWVSRYGKESALSSHRAEHHAGPAIDPMRVAWSVPERSARAIAAPNLVWAISACCMQQAAELLLRTTAALHQGHEGTAARLRRIPLGQAEGPLGLSRFGG